MAKGDELQETGRAVAARRGEVGMTRQELADAAQVDLKTIYNLESGRRWPIARVRVAISAALGWEGDALAAHRAGRAGRRGAARSPVVPAVLMPEELRAAAQPVVDRLHPLLLDAVARTGSPDPPGDEIFERSSWDAQSWDRLRRSWPDPLKRLWLIASSYAPAAAEDRQSGDAAGLAGAGRAAGNAS